MNQIKRWLFNLLFDGESKAALIETWRGGQPDYVARHYQNNVKHGYNKNELIFACVNATADTAAQIAIEVKDRSGKPLPQHPLADLLQTPNPYMSMYDLWWSVIAYQYLGGSAFFEKERNNRGQVIALWPMRPDWVAVVPSREKYISHYLYGPPGEQKARLEETDILAFKLFDLLNYYRGLPPVSVAGRTGDTDNAMTDYIKLFFERGAVPAGYIKTKAKILNEAEAERIAARWVHKYAGWKKWTKPAVLDQDADYERSGLTFEEMGSQSLDSRNEARICMVMRVPPIIVHAYIGMQFGTYANYETAEKAWWRNRLLPLYKSFEDTLSRALVPDFDTSGIQVKFDTSAVQALQEDSTTRWARATSALTAGGITRNQFLEEIGREPIGPRGDVYLISMGMIEVPLTGNRAQPDTGQNVRRLPALTKQGEAPNDEVRRQNEGELSDALTRFFAGQLARIKEAVQDATVAA